jgi:hypothetical protein
VEKQKKINKKLRDEGDRAEQQLESSFLRDICNRCERGWQTQMMYKERENERKRVYKEESVKSEEKRRRTRD